MTSFVPTMAGTLASQMVISHGRSGVAQRIVLLFFIAAFVPLLALSVIVAQKLDADQKVQVDKKLRQDAKAVAVDLHFRFLLAMDQLRFQARTNEVTEGQLTTAFVSTSIVSKTELLSNFGTFSSDLELNEDQVVLSIKPISNGEFDRRVFLSTRMPDTRDEWLVAEVNQRSFLEGSRNSVDSVCIYLSLIDDFMFCNSSVELTWMKLALGQVRRDLQGSFQTPQTSTSYWSFAEELIAGSPQWASVISIPRATSFFSVGDFALRLLQVIGLTLFVVALASLRTIRATLRPLNTLMEKTEELSQGNLDTRIDIGTHDEFGSLGESFNNMALKLGVQLSSQQKLALLGNKLQQLKRIETAHLVVAEALAEQVNSDDGWVVYRNMQGDETQTLVWSRRDQETTKIQHCDVLDELFASKIQIQSSSRLTGLLGISGDRDDHYLLIPGRFEGETCSIFIGPTDLIDLDESQLSYGQQVGNLHATALNNQLLKEQLSHQANHDYLTRLPNRMSVRNSVDELFAADPDHYLVIAIFDVDRFKLVNDSLGHAAGDDLLMEIAKRLKENLPTGVTPSRFAGDEFVLVDEAYSSVPTKQEIIERIVSPFKKTFERQFEISNSRIRVKASIGIAFAPQDGRDFINLLKNADLAMYEAKRNDPGGYCFNSLEIQRAMALRFDLEVALANVLSTDQLKMHYQPIVDLTTNKVIGSESLMRWFKPDGGQVFPDQFIPIAEETGHIIELGDWALNESCSMMRRALDQGLKLTTIAVNVSGIQLAEPNFVTSVARALDNSGLEPKYLELEVTESSLIENIELIIEKLAGLRALGIRIAIDDFGTGYSSLQYLRRLPSDKLKIDQTFVRELPQSEGDLAIIRTITGLARELDLVVLAEGCETEEQSALLRDEGIGFVQGWYYSKALEESDFFKYVADQSS